MNQAQRDALTALLLASANAKAVARWQAFQAAREIYKVLRAQPVDTLGGGPSKPKPPA